jgi:methionyl-tRNA synthetase
VQKTAEALPSKVRTLVEAMRMNEAIEEILQLVRQVNKYMETQAPWMLAKTDLPAAGRVLYTATEALRISAVQLCPVMPLKTAAVLEILGAQGSVDGWGGLKPGVKLPAYDALFPRIEIEKPVG